MVRDTGDPCIEAGENNVSGRGVQIDLYKMGEKGFVSHVNSHQKMLAEKEIINQGDGITLSVRSQTLSPAIFATAQRPTNKVNPGAGVKAMHGLDNMDNHSPRLKQLWLLLRVKSFSSRD